VDAVKASASDMSFFGLFQMEPSVDVDMASLEATFHQLSLEMHPDCHIDADFKTRRCLLDRTAQLNEAYATLSNTERRAVYLLKLCGITLDDKANLPQPPSPFLSRLLELREELYQASVAQNADALQSLERLAKDTLQTELEAGCQCLRRVLSHGPVHGLSHGEQETLKQAATHLLCMRYWQRFLADAELFQEELLS
jgi:Fe-S protein assembly co-chaperone HscB